jgi:hypothetical protein
MDDAAADTVTRNVVKGNVHPHKSKESPNIE